MFIDENAYFWILLKFLASWNDTGARYDPNCISLSHENGFFQFYVFYREPRVKVYRVVLQVGAQKKVGPETKLAS